MIANICSIGRIFCRLQGLVLATLVAGSAFAGARDGFQDSSGRVVNVPARITRVLPAGPPADLLIYATVPDLSVGLVKTWIDNQRPFIPERYRDLPRVPRLSTPFSEQDVATIKDLRADIVVDYGDVTPQYVGNADRMQTALSAAAILLDGSLAATPAIVRRLGALLGRDARAQDIAQLCDENLSKVAAVATAVPLAARPTVYYGRGMGWKHCVRATSTVR